MRIPKRLPAYFGPINGGETLRASRVPAADGLPVIAPYLMPAAVRFSQRPIHRCGHARRRHIATDKMAQGMVTSLITVDTSKAFDSDENGRLLEKLWWFGITGVDFSK